MSFSMNTAQRGALGCERYGDIHCLQPGTGWEKGTWPSLCCRPPLKCEPVSLVTEHSSLNNLAPPMG